MDHISACNKLAKGILSNLTERAILRVDRDEAWTYRNPRKRSVPARRNASRIQPVQRSQTTIECLPRLDLVSWPASSHFTSEIGVKKIDELIRKTWSYGYYSIQFLCVVPLHRFDRFKYVVAWTAPYGASANAFFNVDAARVDFWRPVQVSYSLGDRGKLVRNMKQSSSYHNDWLSALEAHDVANHRYFQITGNIVPFLGC
ncbi:hypothetical protein L596_009699 [Steinernema carpocapsae]|uniref:Uncharacterized protein n=1 Tax=Steinernema carpocapsae TaxID=34508 RepID=A0A4U5PG41_STECR|nr:hypothetical protein L596_009699 [Steinernema carpocapsae]